MIVITTKWNIEFKSTEDNYRKEASGKKNNTVRIVNNAEDIRIVNIVKEIKYIRIKCVDDIQSFVRELTDITRFESHGLIIYIFSW